jgi:sugar lactone lactonase YvrE
LKKQLVYLVIVYVLFFTSINAFSQAPVISYSTPTNVYTVGTAITALVPTNTGGAVPATTYGQVTTLVATGAGLNNPQAIASDNAGNIYVADYGNNLIRKVTSAGVMTTLAGSGTAAEVDNTGALAQFNGPDGIAYDGAGNLYVADAGGNKIRKIVIATGVVTTYAGAAAQPVQLTAGPL